MNIAGRPYRTIWLKPDDERVVQLIDQRALPHRFVVEDVRTVREMATAIREMHVRGAPLIGAAAAYGMYLAMLAEMQPEEAATILRATRPTAVNLAWAIERQLAQLASGATPAEKIALARETADAAANDDAEHCRQIGLHGLELIDAIAARKNGQPVNILTHCNAGWLACVDYGTATAPIYAAHDRVNQFQAVQADLATMFPASVIRGRVRRLARERNLFCRCRTTREPRQLTFRRPSQIHRGRPRGLQNLRCFLRLHLCQHREIHPIGGCSPDKRRTAHVHLANRRRHFPDRAHVLDDEPMRQRPLIN